MSKIIKYGSHCYDSCGWLECGYYVTIKHGSVTEGKTEHRCELFPAAPKHDSRSLRICDKVYGEDYEGEP